MAKGIEGEIASTREPLDNYIAASILYTCALAIASTTIASRSHWGVNG